MCFKGHYMAFDRIEQRRLVVVVCTVAVLAAAVPITQAGSTQSTEISSCTVIDQPGSYVLTADIEDSAKRNCVRITANDVSLDGQGHTIDSNGDGKRGIYVHNEESRLSNVTVRDLIVTDWQDAGAEFEGVDRGRMEHITATGNRQDGIDLTYTDNSTVVNNVMKENEYFGLALIVSTGNTIQENQVTENGRNGIDILYSASNHLVANDASENGNDGIRLYGSAHTVLSDNVVNENKRNGITSNYYSYNNTYTNTTAVENGGWAFRDEISRHRWGDPFSLHSTVNGLDLGEQTVSFKGKDIAIKFDEDVPEAPTGTVGIEKSLNVTNTSKDAFLDIQVPYSEEDVAGVNESTLGLWQYANGSWSQISGSSVDTEENVIHANITSFTDGPQPVAAFGSPKGVSSTASSVSADSEAFSTAGDT